MSHTIVSVWFDYACPHSYKGIKQLEHSAFDISLEIDLKPFLSRNYSIDKDLVQRELEIPTDTSRRPPLYKPGESIETEPASNRSTSTLAIHGATAYAKEIGLDKEFFWAASKEYWERGTDLGNLYTIRRLAISIGIDWRTMWPKLESGQYHRSVIAQHESAIDIGVSVAPSYLISGRLHSGLIDPDELERAVQQT